MRGTSKYGEYNCAVVWCVWAARVVYGRESFRVRIAMRIALGRDSSVDSIVGWFVAGRGRWPSTAAGIATHQVAVQLPALFKSTGSAVWFVSTRSAVPLVRRCANCVPLA